MNTLSERDHLVADVLRHLVRRHFRVIELLDEDAREETVRIRVAGSKRSSASCPAPAEYVII
jgi:hypothetical protein